MDELWERFQKHPEMMYPKWWSWIVICLSIVVFIGGLFGNALVCVALYRNGTMRTVTNYFLLNLAIADFMVILFCLPPSLTWDVTLTWAFGTTCCKIIVYLQTVSVTVSVLTLSFISMERWYAICFPLKFKPTIPRAKTAITVIWILALVADIPELLVYESVSHQYTHNNSSMLFMQCEPVWPKVVDQSWTILKMLFLYAIPLGIMGVMYYRIITILKVSEAQLHLQECNQLNAFLTNVSKKEQQLKGRRKAAKMLASVVTMFALCYFPVHTIEILRLTIKMETNNVNWALSMLSHWLCYANSAINPLIYNFMSKKFRQEFKKSFECCTKAGRRDRPDVLSFQQMGSSNRARMSSRKLQQTGGALFCRTDTFSTKLSD